MDSGITVNAQRTMPMQPLLALRCGAISIPIPTLNVMAMAMSVDTAAIALRRSTRSILC